MPIPEHTINPANAQPNGKIRSAWSHIARRSPPTTPRMIPMIPPASEMKTASVRNCRRISRLRAPIDLRMPILRSLGDAYQHDVHDPNARRNQCDQADNERSDPHHSGDGRERALERVVRVELKIVFL